MISSFIGSNEGNWLVRSTSAIKGSDFPIAERMLRIDNELNHWKVEKQVQWQLNGFNSNMRYTNRNERKELDKTPSILNLPENNFAALIPIKKNDEWWQLTQDERRNIFEEQSAHIGFSLKYLDKISRKLYHSRDLGEPFDFLTWFEFKETDESLFNELTDYLRYTPEWNYVISEIDIRLERI